VTIGNVCCSVAGPMLFSFICKQDDKYKEVTVCHYMHQLMSALSYLHCHGIAHLDVKVSLCRGPQGFSAGSLFQAFLTSETDLFVRICAVWVKGKHYFIILLYFFSVIQCLVTVIV
jgi:serine/threonine protein kinase